jgi:hypothetical protein
MAGSMRHQWATEWQSATATIRMLESAPGRARASPGGTLTGACRTAHDRRPGHRLLEKPRTLAPFGRE